MWRDDIRVLLFVVFVTRDTLFSVLCLGVVGGRLVWLCTLPARSGLKIFMNLGRTLNRFARETFTAYSRSIRA